MKNTLFLSVVVSFLTAVSSHAILIPHDGTGDDGYIGNGEYLLPGPLGDESAEAAWVSGILGKTVMYEPSVLAKVDDLEVPSYEYSWDLSGTGYELCAVLMKSGSAEDTDLNGMLYRLFVPGDEVQKIAGTQVLDFTIEKGISHITGLVCAEEVPDGGATLALLGLGLAGVALIRRKA